MDSIKTLQRRYYMYVKRKTAKGRTNPFLLFLLFIFIITSVSAGIFAYMQFVKVNELNATISDHVSVAIAPIQKDVDDLKRQLDEAKLENIKLQEENENLLEQIEELKKNLIIKAEKDLKIIYLTFDDGPSRNTEKILEILDEYAIKATFFVLGVDSEFGRKAYKNIADRGHTIGIHGYSHVYKDIYADKQAFIQNVDKLADLIYDAAGYETNILRFPGGSNNTVNSAEDKKAFMQELIKEITAKGYTYYDWISTLLTPQKHYRKLKKLYRR
jgi:regulator of replication initiation timing